MGQRPKLGQNFLRDKSIVQKIIESADLKKTDLVLEIGPGKGVLTEELASYVKKVIAVEIDRKLVDLLKEKFKNKKNVEIVEGDVLKIFNSQFPIANNPKDESYKLIANIPYYITSPIIQKFLESEFPPTEMILMVQKEVAERICASPKMMSILAVSVQYYAQPEILFFVPKEAFDPVPEVDSAVIKISNIQCPMSKLECQQFFRVVRAGFCARRKTLLNNLSNSFHLDKKTAEEKLKKAGVNPASRAQEINLDDWKRLAQLF